MEEFFKGAIFGMAVGAGVAAVVVAKNKKLSSKIRQGMGEFEQKLAEAKDTMAEKLEECDCLEKDSSSMLADCDCDNSGSKMKFNKKSKN